MDERRALAVLTLAKEVETHSSGVDASEWQARLEPTAVVEAASTLLETGRMDEALDLIALARATLTT